VVKGHFKAAIFSPAWLWKQELIGPEEYGASEVEIISADVAKFSCLWLACLITPDTLQFSTNDDDEFERVRDAVVGVLRILDQTPVAALGINRAVRFQAGEVERWHAIGDALAPKAPWKGALRLPGMANITMWGVREDSYKGRIAVVVEPAPQLGVAIVYNDHYELAIAEKQPDNRNDPALYHIELATEPTQDKAALALEILRDNFHSSMSRSTEMISHVFSVGGMK
jgi:hypothetical protein